MMKVKLMRGDSPTPLGVELISLIRQAGVLSVNRVPFLLSDAVPRTNMFAHMRSMSNPAYIIVCVYGSATIHLRCRIS